MAITLVMHRTNVFEAAARAKKVAALIAVVYEMSGGPLTDATLAWWRARTPVEWCAIVAGHNRGKPRAEQINAPSKETIALVIETLDRARALGRAA